MKTFVVTLEKQNEIRNRKMSEKAIEVKVNKNTKNRSSSAHFIFNEKSQVKRNFASSIIKKMNSQLNEHFDTSIMKKYRLCFANAKSHSVEFIFIDYEKRIDFRSIIQFNKNNELQINSITSLTSQNSISNENEFNNVILDKFYSDVKNYITKQNCEINDRKKLAA
jgi:hypothetical protein